MNHCGLSLREDAATGRGTVSDRKGRTVSVRGLGDLWAAVEQLHGRPADPLSDGLMTAIAGLARPPS